MKKTRMNKKFVASFIIISTVILFLAIFVFMFLHQVQTQNTFRITVTKFGAITIPHADNSWRIHIEQLTYEKLENAEILIDQGTPYNSASPFPGSWNNRTVDGRAQKEFHISWHPSNITMVWDGGGEVFHFSSSPIP